MRGAFGDQWAGLAAEHSYHREGWRQGQEARPGLGRGHLARASE